MTPTEIFWEYLKPICEGIAGVNYVEISDGERMDRFRADSTSQVVYPGIFVMKPRYKGGDNFSGYLYGTFEVTLYVLAHADMESYAEIDQYKLIDDTYKKAEEISLEIQKVLRHDEDLEFDFNKWYHEPVSYVSLDNAWGSEVKFQLVLPLNGAVC